MSNYLVETQALTKNYGHFTALQDVSVQLEKGNIYGLLGKNGAGKTTLMRLLAGLSLPSSGVISLFGQNDTTKLAQARQKMGCLIENPSIVPYLSGLENLRLQKKLRGIQDKGIEERVFKLVGLKAGPTKKARDYSLGMKQRLGIAITLLNRPELLILDEPINGLDPLGVTEIRKLLRYLSNELGMTILISSHNLPELHQVATHYLIINDGKLVKQMTAGELEKKSKHHLLIGTTDNEQLVQVMQSKLTTNFEKRPDGRIECYDLLDQLEYISKTLTDSGLIITTFVYEEETLEEYFISLVGGGQ